jgi:hypothetical protein
MFDDQKWLACTTVLLILAMGVSTTEAQEVAHSLDELRPLVRVGETLIVTDQQGQETQGTVAEISSASLGLIVSGTRTDFSETDLDTIGRRDSRWNGTLWGLAVGAMIGISFEKGLADEYGRDDISYGSVVVPFAGLGTGIGFAVDAMIKGRRIIYTKAGSSAKNAAAAPVWNIRRKGIFVSLQF